MMTRAREDLGKISGVRRGSCNPPSAKGLVWSVNVVFAVPSLLSSAHTSIGLGLRGLGSYARF